jgi:hypothetical protein
VRTLPHLPELGETESGEGFAFTGEEVLHEPLLVDLERFEFLAFGGDQVVEGGEAGGDLLLFSGRRVATRKRHWKSE